MVGPTLQTSEQEGQPEKLSPIERVLALLSRARPSPRGFVAHCPAHNDRHPSLVLWEDDDGNCRIHCFADCSRAAVCAALGLEEIDLYTHNGYRPQRSQPVRTIDILDLAIEKHIPPAYSPPGG